jgi:hypothetical protein
MDAWAAFVGHGARTDNVSPMRPALNFR